LSTPPPGNIPASPTIPLPDAVRAAYQDLYAKLETAIENTTDVAALEALNTAQLNVDNTLTKDNMYRIEANTELFQALLQQINDTNSGLKTLQDQITSIASHFATAADIIAAINKVLTLFPGT
jgi:hypothetical protein